LPHPRLPVVVGVGQLCLRPGEQPEGAPEPVELMAEAARRAASDSGASRPILEALDSVVVMEVLSWRYANPGLLLARRLGASPRQLALTTTGGNSPQMVAGRWAEAIWKGELDVALVAGAEAMYTRLDARRPGRRRHLDWTPEAEASPAPERVGDDRPGSHPAELAVSLALPVQVYPLFENALRAAAGEGIEEHQDKVARLWARFSEVAEANPHAWTRRRLSPAEIRTPGPSNRMIAFPYPKLMCANMQVDQAAAFLLCSLEAAGRLGVPKDRMVFLHSAAEANDHFYVSERADLASSPAIRAAGRAALRAAGTEIGEVGLVDLYSCFPSAVQIAAAELGLGLFEPDRPLTLTGGLSFAGGPGNNYSTHALCTMVERLRESPQDTGLLSALGWYCTKHAIGVWSARPPDRFEACRPQAEVDATLSRLPAEGWEGPVTLETYTVTYDRDGSPSRAFAACLLDDGRRAWATTDDLAVMEAMTKEEFCGRPARIGPGARLEVG
jgi:acetyl-CoA C-acetyltransferase